MPWKSLQLSQFLYSIESSTLLRSLDGQKEIKYGIVDLPARISIRSYFDNGMLPFLEDDTGEEESMDVK